MSDIAFFEYIKPKTKILLGYLFKTRFTNRFMFDNRGQARYRIRL